MKLESSGAPMNGFREYSCSHGAIQTPSNPMLRPAPCFTSPSPRHIRECLSNRSTGHERTQPLIIMQAPRAPALPSGAQ